MGRWGCQVDRLWADTVKAWPCQTATGNKAMEIGPLRWQGSQLPFFLLFVSSLLSSLYMHVFTHTASQTPLISSGTPLGHDRSAVTLLPCPIACSSDSHTCHDSDAPCLPFPPPGMLPPSHTYMTFLFNCNSLHNEAAMVKHGNPQHFPSWLCFNLSSNYLAQ